MARKSNLPLILLGLGVGTAVTVYILKKYTTILDEANDRFRKAIKGTEFEDFLEEGEKRFARLEREVKNYVTTGSRQLTRTANAARKQAVKRLTPVAKRVKKAAVQAEKTSGKVVASVKKTAKKVAPKTTAKVEKVAKKVATSAKKAKKSVAKQAKKSIAAVSGKAADVLSAMTKNKQYTQKELADLTNIPYRSIRRYVEELVTGKKISENGYGKGKRFMKA